MKNKQTFVISMAILILVIAVTSFFAGTKYQQSKLTSQFGRRFNSNGASAPGMTNQDGLGRGNSAQISGNRGQIGAFRQTVGEIINLDDKSLTIKMTDGSSKIVLLSDSTTVTQSISVLKADLKIGTNIMVNGDTNSDGSISSRHIEINPVFATTTPTVIPNSR